MHNCHRPVLPEDPPIQDIGNPVLKTTLKKLMPKRIFEKIFIIRYGVTSISDSQIYISKVKCKHGIEIGGPSLIFKTILPIYPEVLSLDGVNFSDSTVWEGSIKSGKNYDYFSKKKGNQFISEATDLSQIASESYDFLLSSNCLEHVANPLKALTEWRRVIKSGGALILVLPNKKSNFDHQRPFTKIEHLIEDFNHNTTEHDLTHLDEILALHDMSLDAPAGGRENFKQRSMKNYHNRTLHHHVFNLDVMTAMLTYAGFHVICTHETHRDFFALASKIE